MFGGDAVDVAAVALQRADILRYFAQAGFFPVDPELIINTPDLPERISRYRFISRFYKLIFRELQFFSIRQIAPHESFIGLESEARNVHVLKRLPGEGIKETRKLPAGRAEDRPGIAHDVDELGVRVHFQDHLHPCRRGRILKQQLPPPFHVADLADEELVVLLKTSQRPRTDTLKEQRTVAVPVHVLRQIINAVIADRIEVSQSHLLLLRLVEGQLHVVVTARLRQGPIDDAAGDPHLWPQHVHWHGCLRELEKAELRVAAH